MKKGLCILLTGVLLCSGCSKKEVSSVSSVHEEKPVKDNGAWMVKPDMDLDDVSEITPGGIAFATVSTEKFGMLNVSYEMEMGEYPSTMAGYDSNAVIVEKNSKQGIYSATGKEIQALDFDMMNSSQMKGISEGWVKDGDHYKQVYGITSQTKGVAYVFSSDFKKTEEVSMDDYLSTPPSEETANPYFALQNDVFGVVAMTKSESGSTSGWAFEALDPSVLSTRAVIDTVDEYCNELSKVIYDPSSNTSIPFVSDGNYVSGSFVNGYYQVTSDSTVSLVRASDSQYIVNQYQNTGTPQEGYVPCKKYGKWGYVSLDGTEVTDFIFDDARAVLNGYAYVSYNGKWGVLKFSKVLESHGQINISTVSDTPEDKKLGTVEVMIRDLTIRKGPDSSSEFLGNACEGSIYPYYETSETDGYTWYRITDDAWIADSNGEWVKKNG